MVHHPSKNLGKMLQHIGVGRWPSRPVVSMLHLMKYYVCVCVCVHVQELIMIMTLFFFVGIGLIGSKHMNVALINPSSLDPNTVCGRWWRTNPVKLLDVPCPPMVILMSQDQRG